MDWYFSGSYARESKEDFICKFLFPISETVPEVLILLPFCVVGIQHLEYLMVSQTSAEKKITWGEREVVMMSCRR